MQKRNLAMCIVLSIVTCGIYGIYWMYLLAKDFDDMQTQERVTTTPVVTVLLGYVTCSIYLIFAFYKWGKAMPEINARYGRPPEDKSMLYLLLCIFGLSLVAMALAQNDLNNLDTPMYDAGSGGSYPGGQPGGYPYQQQPPSQPPYQSNPYPPQPGQPFQPNAYPPAPYTPPPADPYGPYGQQPQQPAAPSSPFDAQPTDPNNSPPQGF